MAANGAARGRWPVHGTVGLALALVFWALNWLLPRESTPAAWGFFPLWLGYCLAIDALVYLRKGSSLLTRSPLGYAALFVVSAPGWWLFELLNARTQNWYYDGAEAYSPFWFTVFATLSFSTVMPAVFGTAELVATFGWLRGMRPGPRFPLTPPVTVALFAVGWLWLGLLLAWPQYFFPLLWGAVYLILDPPNVWLGHPSLLRSASRGDWRPVVALSLGCLVCGFFWEMWNYGSYPKWRYQVPGVGFLHVFEMPLLGYIGYVPFAWELCALYHLIVGLAGRGARLSLPEIVPELVAAPVVLSQGGAG